MKSITVLGAGMIGSAIAADLSVQHKVSIADLNSGRLQELNNKYEIEMIAADLSDTENIKRIIADADLIVGALPGFMGFKALEAILKAGKNVVDISFFDEDPFLLDTLAKEKNVTAVVDCGVAPGLSNIIAGYHNHLMKVEEFVCMVGGLPYKRTLPFQYKAPFSPVDVIEEYTRPARIVENGQIVIRPALSEPEYIEVENIGTLEAFNSDGLRTLTGTVNIPFMKEKTLRYPGHIQQMQLLKECGFFSKDEIEVKGIKVSPLNVTAKLLFPQWKYEEGEKEFTYMEVSVKGETEGKPVHHFYRLFDSYDEVTNTSSMARTTAYTCTAAVNLILNGEFTRKGIYPPEYIGEEEKCFKKVLNYLEERKVIVEHEMLSAKESQLRRK
jgi:saccharopine dehydrogenase-like NADP-dependent oxidoreductase